MKKIIIFFIITLMIATLSYAEKEIVYNAIKGRYEVWDKAKHKIIGVIKGGSSSAKAIKKNIQSFPYQPGFPAQIPSGCEYPLVIGDINADNYKEIFVWTSWNDNFLFDYAGNFIKNINWGSFIPVIHDLDLDGIKEIIGNEEYCSFCGVTAKKYTGEKLNGFPNPPGTLVVSLSIEDIDRDGNNEILFAPSDIAGCDIITNHLGLYILGSWGGLKPGFPVIFPCIIPFQNYGPASNYASPTIGNFDDNGIMEVAVTANNDRLYLIKDDGSHYRNWPIRFFDGSQIDLNAPSLGDIDDDGKLEIATTDSGNSQKLFVFKDDASILKGFPVDIDWLAYGSPALADIDRDGKLELYTADGSGRLFGFKNDGTNLPGWPINVNDEVGSAFFGYAPIIAGIDGDGQMEVIDAGDTCDWCPSGFIVAHKFNGSLVNGFPIIEQGYSFLAGLASIADMDNDEKVELCTGSEQCLNSENPAYVFCYKLPYSYDKEKIAWGEYAHDDQHTGRYVNPEIKPPIVISIKPDSASFQGGKPAVIMGENFMQGAKVFFDGIPATNVQVMNSTTIYATIPPHKPCPMYINDISVSPYELSLSLVNQPIVANSSELGRRESEVSRHSSKSINNISSKGCIVNVVVTHPNPDQREGVLRARFVYTGYQATTNNITLMVSKYAPMGTFENNGANWRWMRPGSLWSIIDDSSNCLPKPYPSGHKAMYYGNQNQCNYETGAQNYGDLEMPFIHVDRADAKIQFKYYRDVEYIPNPSRDADRFEVWISGQSNSSMIWHINGQTPSEKQWTQSPDLPLGDYVGEDVRIYFYFDTTDDVWNIAKGVAVDNVELIGAHYEPWAEFSGEVILNWTGGLPKYFVYRGTSPDFAHNPPELRAYTPFTHKYENSLNDDQSYFYQVR